MFLNLSQSNQVALATLALIWLSGSVAALAEGSKKLTFTSIESGTTSGIEERTEFLIRTAEDFKTFWARHKSMESPVPSVPRIDFKKEMVIGVFDGTKPSGGYSLKITEVKHGSDEIVVTTKASKPKPGSMNTQMMTQPYDMVRCEAAPGKLRVVRN